MTPTPDDRHLPIHALIRRFAALRAKEDDGMHDVWEVLVLRTFDRVQGLVRTFRFPNGERMPVDQRDDAVQDAYLRLKDMASTFDGASEGEYYAAQSKCVWYACMDAGRAELRHAKRSAGSSDEPAYEDGDRGRFDEALEADARRRDEDALEKLAEEARLQHAEELLAWGVSQIENANYREVLELTHFEKLDGAEIAKRLDTTTANVYQRRKRGTQKLEEVLRDRRP